MRYAEKTSLASHMLCTAELLLGETVVATGSCMLDTGALEASFISQSMIDSSPLFTPLLTPCSIAVTLGDGKEEKGVYVTSYIQLTVRIPDSRGIPYTAASIWLLVMPALTVDIVIGLPHLMRCFAGCFMSRLNSAIVAAHEAYVDSPPGPPSSHVPITPIAALPPTLIICCFLNAFLVVIILMLFMCIIPLFMFASR